MAETKIIGSKPKAQRHDYTPTQSQREQMRLSHIASLIQMLDLKEIAFDKNEKGEIIPIQVMTYSGEDRDEIRARLLNLTNVNFD